MRQTVRLSLALLCVAAALAGCGQKQENEPAVATPTLTFNKDRIPIDSAVTLTYKFVVAPNATFDKDYWVFVHVLDPQGDLGMSERNVRDIVALPDGRIVFAGPNTGLVVYDPVSGKHVAIRAASKLIPDDHVMQMELDTMVNPPALHVSTSN